MSSDAPHMRPKTAGPFSKKFKEHEQQWYISKFEELRQALSRPPTNLHKDTTMNSNKYLAQTVAAVQQGMEDLFGLDSQPADRLITKLPMKIFRDFSEDGPLMVVLQTAFAYKNDEMWRADGFVRNLKDLTRAKKVMHTALYTKLKAALETAGHLAPNRIYLDAGMSQEEQIKLKKIVVSHGGEIVDTKEEATHIVIPSVNNESAADVEYLRTLEKKDKMALVHWWYYPDSYDEWFPQQEVEGEAEPPQPHKGSWTVTARFLTDLEKYNEWMNEEDYEPFEEEEEEDEANETTKKDDRKRKKDASTDDRKKSRRDRKRSEEHSDDGGSPMQGTTNNAGSPGLEPIKLKFQSGGASYSQQQQQQAAAAASAAAHLQNQAQQQQQQPPSADQQKRVTITGLIPRPPTRSVPPDQVIMPSYASWFQMGKVHDIEKRELPEFFDGSCPSKTQQIYMLSRDQIVKLYRESPRLFLTGTDCRRHVAGDACAIIRIHDFLERWGIINYRVDAESRPPIIGATSTLQQILLATPSGQYIPHTDSAVGGAIVPTPIPTPTLSLRKNVFDTKPAEPPATSGLVCSQCGTSTTRLRYQNLVREDMSICPACYAAGHFTPETISADFRKVWIEPTLSKNAGNGWTEAETLMLLEAIDKYGTDSWDSVSKDVGRTREECILQFIRMPIEDVFLEDYLPISAAPRVTALSSKLPHLFGDTESSIMAQVAALCSSVPSKIAKSAAKAALECFKESMKPKENGVANNSVDNSNNDGDVSMTDVAPENAKTTTTTAGDNNASSSNNNAASSSSQSKEKIDKDIQEKIAKATGIAAAAMMATEMAEGEERKLRSLICDAFALQLDKLEQKLQQFKQLEQVVASEMDYVERGKQQLQLERVQLDMQKQQQLQQQQTQQ